MTKYFSSATTGFFDDALKPSYDSAGTWPEDAVEVSDVVWQEFISSPANGKQLGADSSGSPTWVDTPAPTTDELIAEAKAKQAVLISEARDTISIWQSELLLGTISDDDKSSLTAWISYINELQALDFSSITDESSYDAFAWPDLAMRST
ncbi:tail fiber assembly protein [Mangrovibacter sp. SLW1]